MVNNLAALELVLKNSGLKHYASKVRTLIKLGGMPGVDSPGEEIDIEGVDSAIEHIDKNPGLFIYLDNPLGSEKRFGQKDYRKMPFHYGEITEMNNPSDDMGWDIIIVPSASDEATTGSGVLPHVSSGHGLVPVGYVPVNESKEDWKENTATKNLPEGKPPPVGNDKIILAPNAEVLDEDRGIIERFFEDMWNFEKVVWL